MRATETLRKEHQILRRNLDLLEAATTVNHVLHVHPEAREIFQAFQVNSQVDGCHCLDELYWRRGIDVAELLRVLHGTAMEQECATSHVGGD